jgi:multisubunit Na+/H+ antiporter MnhG subunit
MDAQAVKSAAGRGKMRAMPDLSWSHAFVKYLHVIGVFAFLIGHGVSAMALWRIRSEREPAALRTLLDFSARSFGVMTIGLAVWFFSGLYLGFSGNYWTTGRYWLWASLLVAVVVIGLMTPMGAMYLNRVRTALGVDPKRRNEPSDIATVDPGLVDVAISSGRPMMLILIGFGGVAVLAYLMMFKPF